MSEICFGINKIKRFMVGLAGCLEIRLLRLNFSQAIVGGCKKRTYPDVAGLLRLHARIDINCVAIVVIGLGFLRRLSQDVSSSELNISLSADHIRILWIETCDIANRT